MSETNKKILNLNRNEFIDRRIEENEKFPELTIRLQTIDSILLLLASNEESVLISVMKHLTELLRRNDENVSLLKEKNVLELMLEKSFHRFNSNILIKRFSLYLSSFIIENTNCLYDLEKEKMCEIIRECLTFYIETDDDFCCEYLSVIINKCLDDPQLVEMVLSSFEFMPKYFSTISISTNPDILLHSFELLQKILLVQTDEEKDHFISQTTFPTERLLCELQCEYFEIRKAALKVIRTLILVFSENNPVVQNSRPVFLLEQLIKIFCGSVLNEELNLVIEVLMAAMHREFIASLFFELNLYNKYLARINDDSMDSGMRCKSLMVLTECAKYVKFITRLISSDLTEKLLHYLLNEDNPPAYILKGLNSLTESSDASKRIRESYDQGLLDKLLKLLPDITIEIKTREQASNLLQNLLSYAFHSTAISLFELNLPSKLAKIFAQNPKERSIDLLLSSLNIIEILAGNSDYRKQLCEHNSLIINMSMSLSNSFCTAIMVIYFFRCLSTIVDEPDVRADLLKTYLCSSIKRALQSPSRQVKTSVTNFIMQTTRFADLLKEYIDSGVLETLILNEKNKLYVPTWTPAIDGILSKNPTWKFCIRNNLSLIDTTFCADFLVSKVKFNDFRTFHSILKEEVSPLHPIIVMNFNRCETPKELIVKVPIYDIDSQEKEWCYCRSPGDEFLPKYLTEVINMFELLGLTVNPSKMKTKIDFDNLARRVKVIAQVVAQALGNDLKELDLNSNEECSYHTVKCHLKELSKELHCNFIPLGRVRSGCQFERAILFKGLADQVGLPCTLQRSVDGRILFNEVPLPIKLEQDAYCDRKTMEFMPWRMLRPTHIVDLMYNVGELYPLQSRQALKYLRLY